MARVENARALGMVVVWYGVDESNYTMYCSRHWQQRIGMVDACFCRVWTSVSVFVVVS